MIKIIKALQGVQLLIQLIISHQKIKKILDRTEEENVVKVAREIIMHIVVVTDENIIINQILILSLKLPRIWKG